MNISTGPKGDVSNIAADFDACPMTNEATRGQSEEQRLDQMVSWFSKELNKQPGPAEIYSFGSYMYHSGRFLDAFGMFEDVFVMSSKFDRCFQIAGVRNVSECLRDVFRMSSDDRHH